MKWNATSLLSIYNIIQYHIRTNWRIAVPISMFWVLRVKTSGPRGPEVLTCSFSSDQQFLWRCLILTPHCDPWMKAEADIDYKTLREATLDTQLDFHILCSCCKDLHFLKLAQKLTISVFSRNWKWMAKQFSLILKLRTSSPLHCLTRSPGHRASAKVWWTVLWKSRNVSSWNLMEAVDVWFRRDFEYDIPWYNS